MKNFEFLLCFLLCVLPCVFTDDPIVDDDFTKAAKAVGITREEMVECLNKFNLNYESFLQLTRVLSLEKIPQTRNLVRKAGCFGACLAKKNAVLVDLKIIPERVMELATRLVDLPEDLAALRTSVKACSKRAADRTDECDVVYTFAHCVIHETAPTVH